MHLDQPEKRNQTQQNERWEERHNPGKTENGLYSENTASLMKSVAAPLKNAFVFIKALNYFNGIDLGQSVQALQCGDTDVAIKRLYFKCRNLERRVSNFPV